jgi:hypothetical protein
MGVTAYASKESAAPVASQATKQTATSRLRIGDANDFLEHEADRVADEVMAGASASRGWSMANMPIDPPVQRKCQCGGSGAATGECEECKKKDKNEAKTLQRKAEGVSDVDAAPPIVHEVLNSSGQPLDRATREYFEPRFGYDFGQVRVHADTRAAQSAKAVSARAYAVGNEVAFATGEYAPHTSQGRRLLAHELTHVLQQRTTRNLAQRTAGPQAALAPVALTSATSPRVARDNTKSTVEVTGPKGPPDCTLKDHRVIEPAVNQAVQWLNPTIQKLDAYIGNSADKSAAPVRKALDRHFHSTDAATATEVRGHLDDLRTDINTRTTLTVECHDKSDTSCNSAGAYVDKRSLLVFCPSFFEGGDLYRSETIIHEMAHALLGGKQILDRGYRSDRIYPLLTTKEALNNAESFGLIVQELGRGIVAASTAPEDSFTDCPKDWKPLIRNSIAVAQRWNRNAQTSTSDRDPKFIAGWKDLQQKYLGATTIAAIDSAQKVYNKLHDELSSDIGFECESDAKSGRCGKGAQTYWYAIWSHFHLCPSWKTLASDNERTAAMLAGLYGFLGDADDANRRWNLAYLARDLTDRFIK